MTRFDHNQETSLAISHRVLNPSRRTFVFAAAQLGDRLVEAEINPVFVLPEGRGVRAADGVIVVR